VCVCVCLCGQLICFKVLFGSCTDDYGSSNFVKCLGFHHHHHHISVMALGHLLTRSGLTCPEASLKVCHVGFVEEIIYCIFKE
jgi:hypothetical protein